MSVRVRDRSRAAAHLVVGIQVVYLASALLLYVVLLRYGGSPESMLAEVSSVATLGFIWQFASWKIAGGQAFGIYFLFLVSATLFNGGQIVLEALGLNDRGLLAGRFDAELLVEAVLLVALSLGCLHLGAVVGLAKRESDHSAVVRARDDRDTDRACRWVGTALLLVSSIPAALVLMDVVRTSGAAGYGALYERGVPLGGTTQLQLLSTLLVPGTHFLLAGSKGHRISATASVVLMLAYTMAMLWGGYRALSIIPSVTLLWVWHERIRKVRRRLLVIGACVVLIPVLVSLRETRMTVGAARVSWDGVTSSLFAASNPLVSLVSEMGGSLQTVALTIELVPSERPFDWGMGYALAGTTAFPNLFWDVHPGIVNGSYTKWLIWRVNPWIAEHGGSLGFSFVAEAYANFGWLAPIVMAAIGLAISRFERWSVRRADGGSVAAVAVFGSFLLFFARAESNSVVRGLVWYAIGPLALVHAIRSVSGRLRLQRDQRTRSAVVEPLAVDCSKTGSRSRGPCPKGSRAADRDTTLPSGRPTPTGVRIGDYR